MTDQKQLQMWNISNILVVWKLVR